MASLNKVMIIGHLGRDPELTYTPSGLAVAKFPVATSEVKVDRNSGERTERTEWHRITVFGKSAENCGQYLGKGSQVYAEGRLQTSSYEKDGITRYTTDIIASQVTFLSRGEARGQGGQSQGAGQGGGGSQERGGENPSQGDGTSGANQGGGFSGGPGTNPPPDDDIPF